VGRGTADLYEIVAAGEVHLELRGGAATATMKPSPGYGKLVAKGTKVVASRNTQEWVTVTASVTDAGKFPNYIVKLTPMWRDGQAFAFRLYLDEVVKIASAAISFRVLVLGDQSLIADNVMEFWFQVEVSRY
jgi:hypothetical protein